MGYQNPRLSYIVDQIQQNYTDPKIFAESMALYAKNKATVLADNFQQITDLLTLSDDEGRLYDVNSFILELQESGVVVDTGDEIAGSRTYKSIATEYTQDELAELDLVPMTQAMKEEYRELLTGTMLCEDSIVPNSEFALSMVYRRDGISRAPSEIMSAAGTIVPSNEVVNYTQECIGSVQQLSAAYKQIATSVEETSHLASDFTDEITSGLTELAATLSGPTTQVLSEILATGGSIMDKVKGIGAMLGNAAQQALDGSSDNTGKVPGRISIGEYQPCNLSMAMGQADGAKPFKQVASKVKTAVVVIGALVGKLFKAGASLVKKAWNKYVDPLVSNRIITQDEKAATFEFDVPSISVSVPISKLFPAQGEESTNWTINNLFSPTLSWFANLGEYFAMWFDMTQEEVIALINQYVVGDQMIHIQTDFGSMYIRRISDADAGEDCIGMDVFCTPTSPVSRRQYTGANDGYVFPWMSFGFRWENISNTTHWYLQKDANSSFSTIFDEISEYFGLDSNGNVVNKFNNSSFDIKDPSSIVAGATASMIRWSLYMFMRNCIQCPDYDYDSLFSNDFTEEMYLGYITSSTESERKWQRLHNVNLDIIFGLGLPAAFKTAWQSPACVSIFGTCYEVDWSSYSSFISAVNSGVSTRRANYATNTDQAVMNFMYANYIILAPGVIPTDPNALQTNDFIVYTCMTSLASPYRSVYPHGETISANRSFNNAERGMRNMLATFLGGVLSNKLEPMKGAYRARGVIPPFIPYETTTAMKSQRYHIVTTNEMKNKAQNLVSVIVTGITILAVATAAIILKVKLKKFGKVKLNGLASNAEAVRYMAEDVYGAYQGRTEYEFPNNRIPTDKDKDDAERHGSLDPSIKAEIISCYNKLKFFDFTNYKSSSYFRNKQIPTKEDSVRYNTAAAKAQKKSNLLSKVTSALTGASEDYAGYIDNSKADEANNAPSDNNDTISKCEDVLDDLETATTNLSNLIDSVNHNITGE